MTVGDARTVAWMGAWDRMEGAGQLRNDWRKQYPDEKVDYPPDYHAMVAEAAVYAAMASADGLVGIMAADELSARLEAERAQQERSDALSREFAENIMSKKDARKAMGIDDDD